MYGHVIAKFSRMGSLPHFLTHGAPLSEKLISKLTKPIAVHEPTRWTIRHSLTLLGFEMNASSFLIFHQMLLAAILLV